MIELRKLLDAIIGGWLTLLIFVAVLMVANWGYKQLWAEPPVTTEAIGYYTLAPVDFSLAVDNDYLALKTTGEAINVVLGWLQARSDGDRLRPIKTSYETFYVTAEFPHFKDRDTYFHDLTNTLQAQIDENLPSDFSLKLDSVEPVGEPSAFNEWLVLALTAVTAGLVWILIKEFVFQR